MTFYLGHIKSHIPPFVFISILSIWWLLNVAYRYYSAPYTKKRFTASPSFKCGFLCARARKWPIEGLFRITIILIGSVVGSIGTSGFGFSSFIQNPHTNMYATVAISSLFEILSFFRVPLPPKIEHLTLSASFLSQGMIILMHLHGRPPINTLIHTLWGYLGLAIFTVMLVEVWKRHSYLVSFTRCYLFLLQATWVLQSGYFAQYEEDFGDTWTEYGLKHQLTIVLSYFTWHSIIDLLVAVTIAGLVALYVKCNRHKFRRDDDDDDETEEEVVDIGKAPLMRDY